MPSRTRRYLGRDRQAPDSDAGGFEHDDRALLQVCLQLTQVGEQRRAWTEAARPASRRKRITDGSAEPLSARSCPKSVSAETTVRSSSRACRMTTRSDALAKPRSRTCTVSCPAEVRRCPSCGERFSSRRNLKRLGEEEGDAQ